MPATLSLFQRSVSSLGNGCVARCGILRSRAAFLRKVQYLVEVSVRKLLGALAVAGMAVLFSAPGADAATCWWNGYTWVCRTPPYGGYWRHAGHWRHPWYGPHWYGRHWHEAYGPWRYRHWHHWGYGRPYAWYR